MEAATIKLKYKTIGGFEFAQLMQRIANIQTDTKSAGHIYQVTKRITKARDQIHAEYMKEIREKYAKKTEDGKVDVSGNPAGDVQGFVPDEAKLEEFKAAQDAFGDREFVIDWKPLTPASLKDLQISAKEMDLLGDLYTEQYGPGIPSFDNVTQLHK